MTLNLKLLKIGLYARVSSEKQAQEKTINSQIASICRVYKLMWL